MGCVFCASRSLLDCSGRGDDWRPIVAGNGRLGNACRMVGHLATSTAIRGARPTNTPTIAIIASAVRAMTPGEMRVEYTTPLGDSHLID